MSGSGVGHFSVISWSGLTTSIWGSASATGLGVRSLSGDFSIMGIGLMMVGALLFSRSSLSFARFSRDSADMVTLGLLLTDALGLTLLFMALLFIKGSCMAVLLNLVKLLSEGLIKVGSTGFVNLGGVSCWELKKLPDSVSLGDETGVLSVSKKVLEESGLKIVALARGDGQLLLRLSKTLSNSLTWSDISFSALVESVRLVSGSAKFCCFAGAEFSKSGHLKLVRRR